MKKTKLAMAVSLALAGTGGTIAQAQTLLGVNVNPDGLGQVLLFPYYTVRNGNNTLLAIGNSHPNEVKAVKIRFHEGKNSKDTLDFHIYLSPNDMWTGSLVQSQNGVVLTTADKSCTVPPIPANGVEFRNTVYAIQQPDGEDMTLDRTREGYIEVIEMGVVTTAAGPVTTTNPNVTNLAQAATHVNGVPQDCAALNSAWSSGGLWANTNPQGITGVTSPTGGLFGDIAIVNVPRGTDYTIAATALQNFAAANENLHAAPGSDFPNLGYDAGATSGQPVPIVPANVVTTSNVFVDGGWVGSQWDNRIDAVSAALMHASVINEYTTEPGLNANTDWVLTFPTKNFYVCAVNPTPTANSPTPNTQNSDCAPGVVGSGVAAGQTFGPPFNLAGGQGTGFWTGGAPQNVNMNIFDREETTTVQPIDFSPPSPTGANTLPWEVNTITFNQPSGMTTSTVLGSALVSNVSTGSVGVNGWMNLDLTPGHSMNAIAGAVINNSGPTNVNAQYIGLPVIGFGVEEYVNGSINGVLANFASVFSHRLCAATTSDGVGNTSCGGNITTPPATGTGTSTSTSTGTGTGTGSTDTGSTGSTDTGSTGSTDTGSTGSTDTGSTGSTDTSSST